MSESKKPQTSDLLLSVNRIREAQNRDTAAAMSDGGSSGRSDTNDNTSNTTNTSNNQGGGSQDIW